MLTWMERHPLPFACTTNAPDMLDPATARRFLFKVRFLPMDAGQIAAAFFRAFEVEAPRSILKLELLTPGDFAVVARKAEVLGERDPARLAQWLEDEVAAKPEGKRVGWVFDMWNIPLGLLSGGLMDKSVPTSRANKRPSWSRLFG